MSGIPHLLRFRLGDAEEDALLARQQTPIERLS
jgi:hypothetical protein